MEPVGVHSPLVGSNSSALAILSKPPVTSTSPLVKSVAVCHPRGSFNTPAPIHRPLGHTPRCSPEAGGRFDLQSPLPSHPATTSLCEIRARCSARLSRSRCPQLD